MPFFTELNEFSYKKKYRCNYMNRSFLKVFRIKIGNTISQCNIFNKFFKIDKLLIFIRSSSRQCIVLVLQSHIAYFLSACPLQFLKNFIPLYVRGLFNPSVSRRRRNCSAGHLFLPGITHSSSHRPAPEKHSQPFCGASTIWWKRTFPYRFFRILNPSKNLELKTKHRNMPQQAFAFFTSHRSKH